MGDSELLDEMVVARYMNGGQRRTLVLLFKHSNNRFLFSDPGLEEDRWARKRKEVVNNRWKRKIIGVVFDKGRKNWTILYRRDRRRGENWCLTNGMDVLHWRRYLSIFLLFS